MGPQTSDRGRRPAQTNGARPRARATVRELAVVRPLERGTSTSTRAPARDGHTLRDGPFGVCSSSVTPAALFLVGRRCAVRRLWCVPLRIFAFAYFAVRNAQQLARAGWRNVLPAIWSAAWTNPERGELLWARIQPKRGGRDNRAEPEKVVCLSYFRSFLFWLEKCES